MKIFSGLVLCAIGVLAPQAKADLSFVGSQAGLNAFNVLLDQVSSTDVKVSVALSMGAQFFANTGHGQHPGFAFNINGDPAISITNISAPWAPGGIHIAQSVTGGPSLGTFNYFIDNPGSGTNAHNAGPLSFDVVLASGISINDFTKNLAGYYFVADIANAGGATGLSGISAAPVTVIQTSVPEPSSIELLLLLLLSVTGVGLVAKKRLKAS